MVRQIIKWVLIIGFAAWFFSDVGGAIDKFITVAKACGRLVGELIDGIVDGTSSVSIAGHALAVTHDLLTAAVVQLVSTVLGG